MVRLAQARHAWADVRSHYYAHPGTRSATVHATVQTSELQLPARDGRLARVIAINQDIKLVVRRAFAINLMALNAILAARGAGEAAAGFGVVASEMRRLSITLEQSMRGLRELTDQLLVTTARSTRHAHLAAVLVRAREARKPASAALQQVLEGSDRIHADFERAIALHCKALMTDVDNAIRVSRLGDSLAHLAKIEASWAAAHRAGLATVAGELAQALQSILPVLSGLERKLKEFRT